MTQSDPQSSLAGTTSEYETVVHKKLEGKLILSDDNLAFHSSSSSSTTTTSPSPIAWNIISKHQVSPISYPKSLLKLVLVDGRSCTYLFPNRQELEKIRKEITVRLQAYRQAKQQQQQRGTKRRHSETTTTNGTAGKSSSFGELDPTAMAVTRSSLLAANPSLRAQHQYLVQETETLSEEDFWTTHKDLLEEEYARISGVTKAGTSSLMQSHLQLLNGQHVTLGVEEMRQIFILYPAVHKAYVEKVPLELSDEQFWRKYLESEYFHRDRGRLGAASRNSAGETTGKKEARNTPSLEEQEARAAAVGTDDLFSRYDQKLREAANKDEGVRKWGTQLAVGQFDLASTFATERGNLLEGPKDNHPPSSEFDGKGQKVIQKYNRHWAMVMHPKDAVAGSDLMQVARQSVSEVIPGDEDAKFRGGMDADMTKLVGFAMSSPEDANHALGIGMLSNSDEYEPLTLKNIEAYYSQHKGAEASSTAIDGEGDGEEDQRKKNVVIANTLVSKMKALEASIAQNQIRSGGTSQIEDAFPPAQLGSDLLKALTKKMAQDSKTDADCLEIVNSLPDDFKKKLHSHFRRTSELLRHFFGLRKLAESQGNKAYKQKLAKIVTGMEIVYQDIEGMRKELKATGETGEIMRKMCLQISNQVERAFKLHKEGTGGSGGGGFVTIEEF